MSLYNILYGMNSLSPMLCDILKINIGEIERFRDAGYNGENIWIYTRTGGGNRTYYPNKILIQNENYIKDEDDSFDSTYTIYYFKISDRVKAFLDGHKIVSHPPKQEEICKEIENNPDVFLEKREVNELMSNLKNFLDGDGKNGKIFKI